MPFDMLVTEREGPVGIVYLNRPGKRNALSIALRNELDQCLGELEADDSIRAVIILGKGRVFCAGFDISEFQEPSPEHIEALHDSSERHHRRLAEYTKPLIAGIHGPAMGGGFDVAVLCDVRLASPEATFAHPEIKFGASVLFNPLKEIVGGGLARDLALTGRVIAAQEAFRIGLVSEIVAPDALKSKCIEYGQLIAQAPLPTLKAVKSQIVRSYGGWSGGSDLSVIFPSP